MDLTDTIAPTSDQLDAVDLLTGPRTFTIADVNKGNVEQPVQIKLAEFPRVWRPSKGMRRVLVAAWGPDGKTYAGRRVTLYCDPNVTFGKDKVGGTRISHMTHLKDDKPLSVPLLVTRGKSAMYTVEPLTEPAAEMEALRGEWKSAPPERRKEIEARVAELGGEAKKAEPEPQPEPGDNPNPQWGGGES